MDPVSMPSPPVIIRHNLDPKAFMWLWAKYVQGINDAKHCTHVLRGPYSKALSGHNPTLAEGGTLEMTEARAGAIYVCGVARAGYVRKQNYPHNLHAAIVPAPGQADVFSFDGWVFEVENGRFIAIPGPDELPDRYRDLPDAYTTCRIFRWAVTSFPSLPETPG